MIVFTLCSQRRCRGGIRMPKMCAVCGKTPRSGNNVSHSEVKTRRRWLRTSRRSGRLLTAVHEGSPSAPGASVLAKSPVRCMWLAPALPGAFHYHCTACRLSSPPLTRPPLTCPASPLTCSVDRGSQIRPWQPTRYASPMPGSVAAAQGCGRGITTSMPLRPDSTSEGIMCHC